MDSVSKKFGTIALFLFLIILALSRLPNISTEILAVLVGFLGGLLTSVIIIKFLQLGEEKKILDKKRGELLENIKRQ